jgi:hypothetical protein
MVICGVLFWPTLYRYDKTQSKLVRINRITGYTEVLSRSSWRPVERESNWQPVNLDAFLQAIPKEEIAKIEPKGDFDGKGRYNFKIYNGSDWTLERIKLSIGLNDGNGKKLWHRIYEITADIQPFSIGSCSIEIMDYAPRTGLFDEFAAVDNSQKRVPEVKLEGAFGYKSE